MKEQRCMEKGCKRSPLYYFTVSPLINDILWSQVAEKALFRIRQLQSDITEVQSRLGGEDLGVSWSWKMEEAKLRWARREQDTAMYLLKSLGRQLEKVQYKIPIHCALE